MDPLLRTTIIIVYPLMLLNSMTVSTVYTFLPKLVKEFGISEVDTGYYVGLIASSLFASRTFFYIFWGNVSDKIGRKLPLIITAYGLSLATLAFGFSTTFYWALLSRLMQGCFMVLNVLCKSIIIDVCNDTNFSHGISILISATSVGRLLGPSLGGFLSFPCQTYPSVFSKNSIFEKFPILLPMLIISGASAFFCTLMILYLPNDFVKRRRDDDPLFYSRLPNQSCSSTSEMKTSFESTETLNEDRDNNSKLDRRSESFEQNSGSKNSELIDINENLELEESDSLHSRIMKSKLSRAIKTKECIISCIMYAVYSFIAVGNSETYPLFAATSTDLNGLGFTTSKIGLSLLIASIFLIVFQSVIQPRISTFVGPKRILLYAMLGFAVFYPFLPSLAALVQTDYVLWFTLCLWLILVRSFIALCNLAVNIFIKNSVTSELIGSAMGLAQAANSAGSMLSPSVFGSIYSWSLKNVKHDYKSMNALGFPFNQYFVFYLQSLWAILIATFAAFLPNAMEKKKEI